NPDLPANARVETALLADAGHGQPAIIVRWIEQAIIWQSEDLLVDRAVHRRRIAALEIRATGTADHEAIAGKGHAAVVEHIGQTAVRVPGCGTHQQPPGTERYDVVLAEIAIGPARTARLSYHDAATGTRPQPPSASYVTGMHVSFERRGEFQVQLAEERHVTPDLLEYRINQNRLAALPIGKQISVGRRVRVE